MGETEDDVRNEIGHYAMQYAQDGPIEIKVTSPRKRT
jgi:hypothetical protein